MEIDYSAIRAEIAEILRADTELIGAMITEEEEIIGDADHNPWIGIYLERRDPSPGQPLAGGTRIRQILRFSIWTFAMNFDSVKDACRLRDGFMGKVEKVLMANRTINDTVKSSWLEGGEFLTAKDQEISGFLAGGETVLICETIGTT